MQPLYISTMVLTLESPMPFPATFCTAALLPGGRRKKPCRYRRARCPSPCRGRKTPLRWGRRCRRRGFPAPFGGVAHVFDGVVDEVLEYLPQPRFFAFQGRQGVVHDQFNLAVLEVVLKNMARSRTRASM